MPDNIQDGYCLDIAGAQGADADHMHCCPCPGYWACRAVSFDTWPCDAQIKSRD
jgi:hypothetical protein